LNRPIHERIWDALTSLKLTIALLAMLMVLVTACTLAQTNLGTLGAVDAYIRRLFVWARLPGTDFSIIVFPGGVLVGMALAVNLLAAQVRRLERSWRKAGLWLAHAGLILLVVGEFVTGLTQVESRMAIEEGQTVNYLERTRESELAIIDHANPAQDEVYAIPQRLLMPGTSVAIPGTPLVVRVKAYFRNSELRRRVDGDPPSLADRGIGPSVTALAAPATTGDEALEVPSAFVEPTAGSQSYGTWLVSAGLGMPQTFFHEGHSYELVLRNRREYLPFSVTLERFSHDVYPGTDIPKNFSSLVHLSNPSTGEERDVLIYMNQPLRYQGLAFYQASFGRGDTLSILQVVRNPGWLLPYASCTLVALGLLLHFALSLRRLPRPQAALAKPVPLTAVTPAAVEP
jgi:energy-coupling factor transporter transmembrane protein EcfT